MSESGEFLSREEREITVVAVENEEKGLKLAEDLVKSHWKPDTALFVSGGRTPRALYESIAKWDGEDFSRRAVAMLDERFGEPNHPDSNERMLKETGFLNFLEKAEIPFYKIIQEGNTN